MTKKKKKKKKREGVSLAMMGFGMCHGKAAE